MNKKLLCVIFGGVSPEHEVSCVSAAFVIRNIDRAKFDLVEIGITKDGRWILTDAVPEKLENGEWISEKGNAEVVFSPSRGENAGIHTKSGIIKPDCVFPVLHGKHGEDGTMQGLLTLAGVPFVGCGAASSAICMDKAFTKQICAQCGIKQARWVLVRRHELDGNREEIISSIEGKLGYPLFVKPANTGSSVGVSKVRDRDALEKALELAARYDNKILAEEFIDGIELEIAVMGNKNPVASGIGQILPSREFYTYEAKYIDGTSGLVFGPELPGNAAQELTETALKIYNALDCRGLARVDFFMRANGEIIFNEINTIPGLTSISMFPELFNRAGVSYKELITRLVDFAFEEN
jgi:D-alanine-D-alanine ligase